MTVQVNGQEVTLAGTVGVDWFDDGFTHAEVVAALARMSGNITVRVNSGGGIASEGAAIYATLSTYDGDVAIIIEGIAASAASLLVMAGTTITMADGAVLMIHDPMNITIGNSADHAKTIDELEAYATAYAKVYAKRSGMTPEAAREIMRAETWYDGDAAVAAGFADASGSSKAKAIAAYDYRAYAHAPKRLVAQAKSKGWSMANQIENPTAASATTKEASMPTEKELADARAELAAAKAELATATASVATATASATAVADAAVKADRDRRVAIMALPEAKGREALAEHLFASGSTVDAAKATLTVAPAAVDAVVDPAVAYEAARLAGADLTGAGADASGKATNYGWSKAIAKVGTQFAA